jgi:hypothetical protein
MKILTFIFSFFITVQAFAQPSSAAPVPTRDAADVKSMFSNTYTNLTVDTWRTDWSAALLEDIKIQGNDTKKYSNLDFVGVESVTKQIDVSSMNHFHVDMWTPNMTTFRVKLVDFGADGAFGGGNDTEHEVVFTNVTPNQWNSLDIPLTQFVNLAGKKNIAQLIFSGLPAGGGTVYIDNVFFFNGTVAAPSPSTAAPVPTRDAANVKSMFSNTYTNLTVDTWRTDWSSALLEDIQIQGNDTKKYSALDFVGIETVSKQIDISGMNFFHIDMWTPNTTTFRVKLVDFGPGGAFGGGDDTEHEVVFENVIPNQWNSLDIPLAQFANLMSRKNIAQLIFSGLPVGAGTVYLDNIYFFQGTISAPVPTVAAPSPTRLAANVISMFSNVYTNVAVDTWRTDWSSAVLEDIQIAGNDTKKYSNLDFVGIETVAKQIDISGMSHIHIDMWTPNITTFRVKLVDFGPDGKFQGGDDKDHEVVFENVVGSTWNGLDIPLTQFVNLTTRKNIAQLIFSGLPVGAGTVYIDNVYFYNAVSGPTAPLTAAPTPTRSASGVISMFSNAYTNVAVDTWRTDWSAAMLEDIKIQGNDTKKYSSLDFVGVETVSKQINVTGMSHFHVDMWTPNMTTFRIKLVDFGADGAFGGGDDTEHEIVLENPALGQWNSLDIPLTQFANLAGKKNIAQLIFSGLPTAAGTLFIDNVYFYDKASNVNNFVNQKNIAVYPNPSVSGTNLSVDTEFNTFELYHINGQLMEVGNQNSFKNLNLNQGMYIVKFKVAENIESTVKLIVK